MVEEKKWFGTIEAANELGVTLRSVYKLINEGKLSAYKFGRVIRLKIEDIETFKEKSKVEPGDLTHLYPPSRAQQHDNQTH